MRPAIDRICAVDALPVRNALPATLASSLVGGLSGVDFLAMCASVHPWLLLLEAWGAATLMQVNETRAAAVFLECNCEVPR
jgi:hypothetical protein